MGVDLYEDDDRSRGLSGSEDTVTSNLSAGYFWLVWEA